MFLFPYKNNRQYQPPCGHGDVVEGEPGGGQQAQAPPLAHGLPLLAGLRGTTIGAALLAGGTWTRGAGEREGAWLRALLPPRSGAPPALPARPPAFLSVVERPQLKKHSLLSF